MNSLLIHFFTLFMEHLACGEAILEVGHKLGILSRCFSSLRLEHFVKTIRLSPNNIPGIVIDIEAFRSIFQSQEESPFFIFEKMLGENSYFSEDSTWIQTSWNLNLREIVAHSGKIISWHKVWDLQSWFLWISSRVYIVKIVLYE